MKPTRAKNVQAKQPISERTSDTREQLVEVLKQNVLKWEEAANSIGNWMPKVMESDRVALAERGRQYTRNARELRDFVERLAAEERSLFLSRTD